MNVDMLHNFNIDVIAFLQTLLNQQGCNNPETMDDTQLKQGLHVRGLSVTGARTTLIERYLKSDTRMYKCSHNYTQALFLFSFITIEQANYLNFWSVFSYT